MANGILLTSPGLIGDAPELETNLQAIQPEVKFDQEKWQKAIQQRQQQAFQEWKEQREKPVLLSDVEDARQVYFGGEYIYSPARSAFTSGLGQYLTDRISFAKKFDKAIYGRAYKEAKEFREFYNRREQARFSTLSPGLQRTELGLGGTSFEAAMDPQYYRAKALQDGLFESLSFGFYYGEDEIYADQYKSVYPMAYGAGRIIGELASFITLTGAAKWVGAPAALSNLVKRSGTATRILRSTGNISASMSKTRSVLSASSTFAKSIAKVPGVIRGVKTTTAGAFAKGLDQFVLGGVMMASDSLKAIAAKTAREDKQSTHAYYKNLPLPMITGIGFFKGMGMNIINSPASLPMRILLDAGYSSALQTLDVVSGSQKDWDWSMFFKDIVVGNAFGEADTALSAILRRRGSPRVNIEEPYRDIFPDNEENITRIWKTFDEIKGHPEYPAGRITDEDTLLMAIQTRMADETRLSTRGTPFTAQETDGFVRSLFSTHEVLWPTKQAARNPNTYRIDTSMIGERTIAGSQRTLDLLSSYFKWSDDILSRVHKSGAMETPEKFLDFIKGQGVKIRKSSPVDYSVNDIPGITWEEFAEGMNRLVQRYRLESRTGDNVSSQIRQSQAMRDILEGRKNITDLLPHHTDWDPGALSRRARQETNAAGEAKKSDVLEAMGKVSTWQKVTRRMDGFLRKTSNKELKRLYDAEDLAAHVYELIESRSPRFYEQRADLTNDKLIRDAISTIEKDANTASRRYRHLREEGVSLDETVPGSDTTYREYLSTEDVRSRAYDEDELRAIRIEEARAQEGRLERGEQKRKKWRVRSDEANNQAYHILLLNAQRSPSNFVSSLVRYYSDVLGMDNAEIKRFLGSFGINRRETAIQSAKAEPFRKKSLDAIVSMAKQEMPLTKEGYTLNDIRSIYQAAKRVQDNTNPVTGLFRNIDSGAFRAMVNKHGAVVINVREFVDKMLETYGATTSYAAAQSIGQYIKRIIDIRNKDLLGAAGQLHVFNPVDNNSSYFIITGHNIKNSLLHDVSSDIYNTITKRYAQTDLQSGRGFGINISRGRYADQEVVLDRVEGAMMMYTRDSSDIMGDISDVERVRSIILSADKTASEDFGNVIVDITKPEVSRSIDSIINTPDDIDPNEIISAKNEILGIEEIPRMTTPSIEMDHRYDYNQLLGLSPQEVVQQKVMHINEKGDLDLTRAAKNSVPIEDINEVAGLSSITEDAMDKGIREISSFHDEFAKDLAEARQQRSISEGTFFERIRARLSRGRSAARDYAASRLDVYEEARYGRKVFQDVERAIQRRRAMASNDSAMEAKGIIQELERPLYQKYFLDENGRATKGAEVRIRQMWNMMDFVREEEFRLLYEDFDKKILKENIEQTLRSDIGWSKDMGLDYRKLMRQPDTFGPEDAYNLKAKANDDLLFSKLIVQEIGIEPEDFIKFLNDDDILWGKIQKKFDEIGAYEGAFVNRITGDRIKNDIFRRINNIVQRQFGIEAAEKLDIHTEAGQQQVSSYIRELKDRDYNDAKFLASYSNMYLNYDFDRLSYISHRVLEDPDGRKLISSKINADLHRLESGRVQSVDDLGVVMKELRDRKYPTLMHLIEDGYKPSIDGRSNRIALLKSLEIKAANVKFADNLKQSTKTVFNDLYEPIRELFNEVDRIKGRTDVSPRVAAARINEIAEELEGLFDKLIVGMTNNGGVIYFPSSKEKGRLNKIIKNGEEVLSRKDELKLPAETVSKIQADIDQAALDLKVNEEMMSFYTGSMFTKANRAATEISRKSKDIDFSSEQAKAMENSFRQKESLRKMQIAASLMSEDDYMPLDVQAHVQDIESRLGGKNKKNDLSRWNAKEILSAFKTEIPRDKMIAPSLPGFEGLYAHRVVHKQMKQFLYRNDYLTQSMEYEAQSWIKKGFDRMNMAAKMIQLYKPFIVTLNGVMQGQIGVGAAKLIKNINFSFRAVSDKLNKSSEYGRLWRLLNQESNIYNTTSGIPPALKDAERIFRDSLGQGAFSEAEAHIRDMLRTNSISREEASREIDAINKAKKYCISAFNLGKSTFRLVQNSTWFFDEVIRTSMAKTLFDKYFPVKMKLIKKANPGIGDAEARNRAERDAAYEAGTKTNDYMVEYSRLPSHVKRNLNRVFMFPTFRIGEIRMHKRIVNDFAKGLNTLKDGIKVGHEGQVSFNKTVQALHEMGPALRYVATKAAVYAVMYGGLGYGLAETTAKITGYRFNKREDETDPMRSAIQFLTLSTPLFAMDKYLNRDLLSTAKLNIAAFPTLLISMATNKDLKTNRPIITVPMSEQPLTASSQLGLYMLKKYMPFGRDIEVFADEDLELSKKIIQFSGIGYFYDIDSPQKIIEDFNRASSEAVTVEEHQKAVNEFYANMRRTQLALFDNQKARQIEELRRAQRINVK